MLQATIGHGPFAYPRAVHRLGRAAQLLHRRLRQHLTLVLDRLPVGCHQPLERFAVEGKFAIDAFRRHDHIALFPENHGVDT